MDYDIQTGQTRTRENSALLAKSLASQRGEHVFILLQVEADPSAAKGFQREAIAVVTNALLETEGDATERLDSTLKELNGLIKGLLLSKTIKDVHAIVGLADTEQQLHVSHAGRAEAYVVRGGTATQITEYTKGKPAPAFVHIASGQLEPRDTVILSTQRLLRSLTPAQLAHLAAKQNSLTDELKGALEAEREQAALAVMHVPATKAEEETPAALFSAAARKGRRTISSAKSDTAVQSALLAAKTAMGSLSQKVLALAGKRKPQGGMQKVRVWAKSFGSDLRNPDRKRRAHLLLLAGVVAVFLVVWVGIRIVDFGRSSHTRAEISTLMEEIAQDMRTAENRRLTGEIDSATAILARAEERARQVINNQQGYYREEALAVLARIQTKKEEIHNITRLSPTVAANLAGVNSAITAQGLIGLSYDEFLVYDRQDIYRVIHNSVDSPNRIGDEELILHATNFPRYQTTVYQMTGNSIIEIIAGQPVSMKTEDAAGWITGTAIEAYLRYLYVLSPENNQIYKYERLSNRYTAPVEYNINGKLEGGLDIAIDGNVYVLKEGGEVVKLLRGEVQPLIVRNAPEGMLKTATKMFKAANGKFYFLDPVRSRVVIATDGGASGESAYERQYILEGDTIGILQDIYVDPDEARLYVLDEKRIYRIDL